MYSYEDRIRAVKLYLKLRKRLAATVRQLGYPTTKWLERWYHAYERCLDLPRERIWQSAKHRQMQSFPHTCALPIPQSSPACHAAAETKPLGRVLPCNARLQYIRNAAQWRAVVDRTSTTTFGRRFEYGNQWFQRRPHFVADFASCHAPRIRGLWLHVQVVLATLNTEGMYRGYAHVGDAPVVAIYR